MPSDDIQIQAINNEINAPHGCRFFFAVYRQLIIHVPDWISIIVREIDLFRSGQVERRCVSMSPRGDAGQKFKQVLLSL